MNKYITQFLKLKCAGDVLNIVSPINHIEKEITEAMAVIRSIKKITIDKPMEYTIIDLCAGNALSSVISAFLLPIKKAIAIDKKKRNRKWHLIKNFEYIEKDIFKLNPNNISQKTIITAIHPCSTLAEQVIDIFYNSLAEYLVLMPCCSKSDIGNKFPALLQEKLTNYNLWCYYLYQKCAEFCEKVEIFKDKNCLSPKNIIIKAKKEVKRWI